MDSSSRPAIARMPASGTLAVITGASLVPDALVGGAAQKTKVRWIDRGCLDADHDFVGRGLLGWHVHQGNLEFAALLDQ
jgi:hypothetical protein